ncbi:MAG: hypothetical protein AAFX87_08195 [Bacteroidota bacterium]
METPFKIPVLTTDSTHISIFKEATFPETIRGGMILTDRINAQNLRLRVSEPGYTSDWHVAGDPTLIIIQQGTLRVILQDGSYKDFSAGDMFIAQDYLPEDIAFDPSKHGHRAEVIGDEVLRAVHVKLKKRQT